MPIKVYKKLSEEQLKKGIIFTSTLSTSRTELKDDVTHEVYESDSDKWEKINRLMSDSFFRRSHYKYNIIRR